MKYMGIKGSQGHAALLFVILAPALFGIFTLGSDGARALLDKARLNEAMEVASLAVSAQDSDQESIRKQTAKNFISYYFPTATITDDNISVTKTVCDPQVSTDGCDSSVGNIYLNYKVTVDITQNAWFPGNSNIVGFGKTYDVSALSVSRKYQAEAIDVMLVADFSASMYDLWDGQQKFVGLINVIAEIASQLNDSNLTLSSSSPKSKIGVVGYDFYTKTDNGLFAADIYCSSHGRSELRNYWSWDLGPYQAWYWYSSIPSPDGRCDSHLPTEPDHNTIDVSKTISKIFSESDPIHNSGWNSDQVVNISKYTNIELTSDITGGNGFNSKIKNKLIFNIPDYTNTLGSGTSSFTGIIRAAQFLNRGSNSKRLMIILSDGGDSNVYSNQKEATGYRDNNFSDQLYGNEKYKGGLCSSIRKHFTDTGIDMHMAVIGFDYDMSKYPQLANCVGSENVYSAENMNDIKNRILSLITDEIGRLAN